MMQSVCLSVKWTVVIVVNSPPIVIVKVKYLYNVPVLTSRIFLIIPIALINRKIKTLFHLDITNIVQPQALL